MIRSQLIKAIFDSDEMWSCPDHPCDFPEEKGSTGVCWECAEKQLAEHEAKVRADAYAKIDELIAKMQESAESQMMFKHAEICELIREGIKEQK